MYEETQSSSGLDWLWAIWQRRKLLALGVFTVSLAGFLGLAAFLPQIYRATATVLVDQEQVRQDQFRDTSGRGPAAVGEVETRLQTINQQILSRARLLEVINRFDPYPEMRGRARPEDIVDRMRNDIRLELKSVEQEPGHRATVAFALSYQGRDPKTVAAVTNALAAFFVDENWKLRGQQATETASFLKRQVDEMKQKLDGLERRAAPARTLASGGAVHERLGDQLRLNSDRLARATDRREALAKQLSDFDPGGDPRAKTEHLAKLKRELSEMRSRLTDKHPDVIRAQAEITAIESGASDAKFAVKSKGEATSDPTIQRIRNDLREVDAEIANLKREGRSLQENFDNYQKKLESARESPDVVRDYETTKEVYASLMKRYVEAQQAENVEQTQKGEKFRILDPALPPGSPAAPNRSLIKLMGFLLSFGLAAVAVMLAEQLDTSFHTADSLRTFTKIPVLVRIRRIITDKDRRRARQRLRLKIAAAMACVALMVGFSYYFAHNNEGIVHLFSRSPRAAESAAAK
ncbi:MAG TPA: GNVR domain-containing protein [Candidatus Binatia bacterium]